MAWSSYSAPAGGLDERTLPHLMAAWFLLSRIGQ